MNIELKVKLQRAIDKVICEGADDGLWNNLIHPKLIEQMTAAAELVFDAGQDAQDFLTSHEG